MPLMNKPKGSSFEELDLLSPFPSQFGTVGGIKPDESDIQQAMVMRYKPPGMAGGGAGAPAPVQQKAPVKENKIADVAPKTDVGISGSDAAMGLGLASQAAAQTGAGGLTSGALSGASIGTYFGGPGVGTAIGAGVGALAGGLGDRQRKEMEKRANRLKGLEIEIEGRKAAERQRQQGVQQGISQMLAGYGRALG